MKTLTPRWRKSTYTAQEANCVEIHADLDAVRDSKDRTGPALRVNVPALITAIRAGRLGR